MEYLVKKMYEVQFLQSLKDERVLDITQDLYDFLERLDDPILFVKLIDDKMTVKHSLNEVAQPGDPNLNFCYIIKKTLDTEITPENVENSFIVDYVNGDLNQYLLIKTDEELSRSIFDLPWTEGIKSSLISNMHKFLMALSQSYYRDQKKIILYIPKENFYNTEVAYKDKELVSRLEQIMAEWTNQIREFISSPENTSSKEDFDVLQEIDDLESRKENLLNIASQLNQRDIKIIVEILKKAKGISENLKIFNSQQEIIEKETPKTEKNHKFLKILRTPCEAIKNPDTPIKDVPDHLKTIMSKIRVITEMSDCYTEPSQLAELLKKVSFQLIHKFTAKIQEHIENIDKQYSPELHKDIKDIQECAAIWSVIFERNKKRVEKYATEETKAKWNFEQKDEQIIFYDLETFKKRCENLNEICQCQLQFGKGGDSVCKPVWGGTKRIEISKQLQDIETKFDDKMKKLFENKNNVLNTKVNKWQEPFRNFQKHIEDLEDMYKNTISSAFKRVNTVEEAVNYVENFNSLAQQKKIKDYLSLDIGKEVVALITKEIEKMRAKNETKTFVRLESQTLEGGNLLWCKYLQLRKENYQKELIKMNQILSGEPDSKDLPYLTNKIYKDYTQQMDQLDAVIKDYLSFKKQEVVKESNEVAQLNDDQIQRQLSKALINEYVQPAEETKAFRKLFKCNYQESLLKWTSVANVYSKLDECNIPVETVKKINSIEEEKRILREYVINTCREYNALVLSIKNETEHNIFREEFTKLENENMGRLLGILWNSSSSTENTIGKIRRKITEISGKIGEFKENSIKIADICDQISKRTFFYIEKNSDPFSKEQFQHAQEKICQETKEFIEKQANQIVDLLARSYSFIETVDDIGVFYGFKQYIEDISEKNYNDALEKALTNSILFMKKAMFGEGGNNWLSVFFRVDILLQGEVYKREKFVCEPDSAELIEIINNTTKRMEASAINSPDIYQMFGQRKPAFLKKFEKKRTYEEDSKIVVDKTGKPLEVIKEEKEEKKEDKKKKPKKGQKGKDQKKDFAALLQGQTKEKEKSRFPKASAAKAIFNGDLQSNDIEAKFYDVLSPWKINKRLAHLDQVLHEEETKKKLNKDFETFIVEGTENMSEGTSLTSILQEHIIMLQKLKNEASSNSESTDIPPTMLNKLFIQFDSKKLKDTIIDLCDKMINYNVDYITQKTKELMDSVNNTLDEHEEKFGKEPETQDEWSQYTKDLEEADEKKNHRFKMIDGSKEVVEKIILALQSNTSDNTLKNAIDRLEKRKEVYNALLEGAHHTVETAKAKLSKEVQEQEKRYNDSVALMHKNFFAVIPDKLDCPLQQEIEETYKAQKTLRDFEQKCAELSEEEKRVEKGILLFQDVFNKKPQPSVPLSEVIDQIAKLKAIWDIKFKMNKTVKIWRETQFFDFKLDEMEKERFATENRLKADCKGLVKRPIYITMKEQLELYKTTIEILTYLRDDAMSENSKSHWEKVRQALGKNELEPNATNFNFETILELHLENHRNEIEAIVEYAREQQKLGRGLDDIQKEWLIKELQFTFTEGEKGAKEDESDFSLKPENKAWVDVLEGHLAKIAEYKSTRYYEDFKSTIDEIETELNKFFDLFQLLKQVQDKRNYLKNIFSKDLDDIYQQAGTDLAIYKTYNAKYIDMCREFSLKRKIRECFLVPDLDQKLTELLNKFDIVERSMNALLDTKRKAFKRFYFLSNDDLFELMGNYSNMNMINPHLTKLFSGIECIERSETKQTGKAKPFYYIRYVYDKMRNGEQLRLQKDIIIISVIETWLWDLEKCMISTLKSLFNSAYKDNTDTGNEFTLFMRGKDPLKDKELSNLDLEDYFTKQFKVGDHPMIGQLLLTMQQYVWMKKIRYYLDQACKDDKMSIPWDAIANSLNQDVLRITKFFELKKKLTYEDKKYVTVLYNYILLKKYLKDLTTNLRNEVVRSPQAYEWLKILKVNFEIKNDLSDKGKAKKPELLKKMGDEGLSTVYLEQLNYKLNYGYEYIGNKERLVITPLTERCFITMTTAIFNYRGGSLQGPAGTGKTETIKDLSRNIAKYVIVFNCSNKNSYNTMSTLFMGVINTGAWICFDEFNRLEIEVLSVIRILLITIFDALRAKAKSIPFRQNAGVTLNNSLAIFITMNPQYIFRSELPENLKSLFRPIALKAADREKICEMRFLADGYGEHAATMAKLLIVSIDVLEQQMSSQPHYDYSLRNILSILKYASTLKSTTAGEDTFILRMAISEMLKPKLIEEDENIFDNALSSVFNDNLPSDGSNVNDKIEQAQASREDSLREDIRKLIEKKGLTGSPFLLNQTIQLYNNMNIKHGIMLVGETFSGKSTTLRLLQSLNQTRYAAAKGDPNCPFTDVEIRTIYPKSVELDELYGKVMTGKDNTYIEGLLPFHLKDISNARFEEDNTKTTMKWLVLDAPVDTLWVESLNTLLDDTKMLSLPSGFRINLKSDVKVVFEAENLTQATPATISRVGLVYFETDKLSWFPIARKWLDEHKASKEWYEFIAKWFDKYVYGILEELEQIKPNYLIEINHSMIVHNLISIYNAFLPDIGSISNKVEEQPISEEGEGEGEFQTGDAKYWELAERLFVFSLMWALGSALDDEGRNQIDSLIRKYSANFPPNTMIFDYYVNPEKDDWATWDEKMVQGWTPPDDTPYKDIFVPTADIIKTRTIIQYLLRSGVSPFIIGEIGTGKSSIIKMIYAPLDKKVYMPFQINLSYLMSSNQLQKLVETNFEKRNNKLYPPSNKKSFCYIDDLNLPKKDEFGCQTIVEMIRQYMELEGWYSVEKLTFVNIKSMQLIASSCVRNKGEKSIISSRFFSKFVPVGLLTPNEREATRIFSTILGLYLSKSQSEDVKKLNETLAMAAIGLFQEVKNCPAFQPTPRKCHYVFTFHDITKVLESISKVKGSSYYTKEYYVKIFVHEAFRTYADRFIKSNELTGDNDASLFKELLTSELENKLSMTFNDTKMKDSNDCCVFVDGFLEPSADGTENKAARTYDEVPEYEELRKLLMSKVEPLKKYDDMVFFEEAVYRVFFLRRLLYRTVGCHALLIGLGSSGRSSYSKIASEISGFKTVKFNGSKETPIPVWIEQLRKILKETGEMNKPESFIIKERDINCDLIMEHIHYLLTLGMVPGLYSQSDWEEMKSASGNEKYQKMPTETFINTFKANVRENLRMFMAFSPHTESLRNYSQKFPSIIDYTTIITFTDWPESALLNVARKFIDQSLLEVGIKKEEKKKEEDKKDDKKKKEEKKEEKNEEKKEEKKEGDEPEEDKPPEPEESELLITISDIFAKMHMEVSNFTTRKMEKEMRRQGFFTSQNFIVLIRTFNKFLKEKVDKVNSNIEKYKLGLNKIEVGKKKIEEMKGTLEEKGKEESEANSKIQELIEELEAKRKIAEEQQNIVKIQQEQNEKDMKFFLIQKAECEKEMLEAKKPMEEAVYLISEKLNRDKLAQYKGVNETTPQIKNVFFALMAIFNKPPTWDQVRSYLQNISYEELCDVEHLKVTQNGNFKKITDFSRKFDLDVLRTQNSTIPDLAQYIQCVEKYFKAKWTAEIKEREFEKNNKKLMESLADFEKLKKKLDELNAEIADLEERYRNAKEQLNKIRTQGDDIKKKIGRATSLTTAFAKEEEAWTQSLANCQELLKSILGNTLLSSAYLTYFGIFPGKYREELKKNWGSLLKQNQIVFSSNFDFITFISNENEVQNWKIDGLPDDKTFIENGVIMKYSLIPSLIIDPQEQAMEWIKKSYDTSKKDNKDKNKEKGKKKDKEKKEESIMEMTLQTPAYMMTLRENISKKAIIMNNLGELLPPELEEFLKSVDNTTSSLILRTKLPNPKYNPEVASVVNIINFLVTEKGLEEQLLSQITGVERAEAENQIKIIIKKMFNTQREVEEDEENILYKLNHADDNYLDDDALIQDLNSSTQKSAQNQELISNTKMEIEKVNASREEFRNLAKKVSKYFFVLYSMNNINNMYEFSLKSYKALFNKSLEQGKDARGGISTESTEERIVNIEKSHLEKIVNYANQCLFENHRLVFAFQLCLANIIALDEERRLEFEKKGMGNLINQKKKDDLEDDDDGLGKKPKMTNMPSFDFFNVEEFNILISSNYEVADEKMIKPEWLSDKNAWNYLIGLEKIPDLKGIISSFAHNAGDWHKWYQNKEIDELPVEWESKCKGSTNLRKLLFVRALRPDKISYAIKDFISKNLDVELKDSSVNLQEIVKNEVTSSVPLLIVHGGGVEPSENIAILWEQLKPKEDKKKEDEEEEEEVPNPKEKGKKKDKEKEKEKEKEEKKKAKNPKEEEKEEIKPSFSIRTLNQDEWKYTNTALRDMAKVGGWVYIANTHLTIQNIPLLEKTLDEINASHPHKDFKVFISTYPHEDYPISLLQRCNKITFEMPKGIYNNMSRLFDDISKETLMNEMKTQKREEKSDQRQDNFGRLVYSLGMFHAMLIERKRFKGYGFTKQYDFNDSDFKICLDIIKNYSKQYPTPQDFPWKALQDLIAINYGSRFTNDKDKELLNTYSAHFFTPGLITDKGYNLSSCPDFPYIAPTEDQFNKFKNTSASGDNVNQRSDFYNRMVFFKEETLRLKDLDASMSKRSREDPPEVFGLHFNAEISSQIAENLELLDNIKLLNRDLKTSTLGSADHSIMNKIKIAMEKIPKPLEADKKKFEMYDKDDKEGGIKFNPITNLLYQESEKYNKLIEIIREDLIDYEKALKGHITITPAITNGIRALEEDKIPIEWLCMYLSTKSFIQFLDDLNQRIEFFRSWIGGGLYTPHYYLGYFTNPNAFITAIKQKFSLSSKVPFHNVSLIFKVINEATGSKAAKNANGYLIKGIYIEGGCWDVKNNGIKDESVQDLIKDLPSIIITPNAADDKNQPFEAAGVDTSTEIIRPFPLYYIPIRGDYLARPTYIMDIPLNIVRDKDKEGNEASREEVINYWIKKGTCLLLSKNDL
ncbi:MAG: hypothetical protein MJ252_00145 [archaeon]|nr:hypothetical protein [archaeon]